MGRFGGDKVCLRDQHVNRRSKLPCDELRCLLDESLPLRLNALYKSRPAIARDDVEDDFRSQRNRTRFHIDRAVIVVRIQDVSLEPLVA